MERKVKIDFVVDAALWFDRPNGNTYHACRVTRIADGETLHCPLQYGYGEHYRQTALEAMAEAGWLPSKYDKQSSYLFERENNYPIHWSVRNSLKRDAIALGGE